MTEPNKADRFRGLMLGTAVGDCLGRPVEGHRTVPASYLDEVLSEPQPLIYTDDTAMTIRLAESLLAVGGFDGSDMARRFAQEYRDEPHRGYGRNIVDVFDRVLRGEAWDRAASRQFGGEGSHGNGAAMRVAPVALWQHESLFELAWLAGDTARVTHTHPVGMEGAVLQAIAAHHALRTTSEIDRNSLLTDLDRFARTEQFRSKLEILPTALDRDDDEFAALQLGNSVAADKSVVTASYCFLAADSFTDAILRALRMGGDTDTIGAMTGALAGARFGYDAIPADWREPEGSSRLIELADALLKRHG